MAYTKERMDGTISVYPHKMRVMLKNKISEMLSRYSLDEVLSEIAQQRPTFNIHVTAATESHAAKDNGAK